MAIAAEPMAAAGSGLFWAALSACFAALTAIFAKIGIQRVKR